MDDDEFARYLAAYLEQHQDDFIHVNRYDEAPYEFYVDELAKLIAKFDANLL